MVTGRCEPRPGAQLLNSPDHNAREGTHMQFLRTICEALRDTVDDSIVGDFSIKPGIEWAESVWGTWNSRANEQKKRDEIQQLVSRNRDELEELIDEVVSDVARGYGEEIKISLANFVMLVPGTIRNKLRRPSNPQGTAVPQGFQLRSVEDLADLLPPRLPRFEFGDRPAEFGDWELVQLLGIGPYGETWKAINPRSDDVPPVLLMFVSNRDMRSYVEGEGAQLLDRVLLEARHQGIVSLKQLHLQGTKPCLEYEFVDAADLRGVVAEWQESGQEPKPLEVAEIVRQVAEAVGFVHELKTPIIHRYLSPSNILVWKTDKLHCKVANLSLGQWLSGADQVSPFALYASPQQVQAAPPSPRDDVYALGVIWYQLLTRNLSQGRPGGSRWRRNLAERGMSSELIELLESCFEDEPEHRPETCAVLAKSLAELSKSPIKKSAESASKPATPPQKIAPTPSPTVPAQPQMTPTQPKPAATQSTLPRQTEQKQHPDTSNPSTPAPASRPKIIENTIGMKLALIPAGQFQMGSPPTEDRRRDNEGPQHEVFLTKSFYLAVHPVTQDQYECVMETNPSHFRDDLGGGLSHPVEMVNWTSAITFCRLLSEMPEERKARRRYRLPTEAEWEYGCRGGTQTPFYFGSSLSHDQANFEARHPYGDGTSGLALNKTTPVGSYLPNAFGIYDAHGNVWEWCADWFEGDYYRNSPRENPPGPLKGQFRVLRGGSWRNHATTCRSAYRNALLPSKCDMFTGFRVVLLVS